MTGTRLFGAAALVFVASTCSAVETGIVSMNIGSEALLYSTAELTAGDRVHFQYPDNKGRPRCCIVRTAKSFEVLEPDAAATDALEGIPVLRYRLTLPPRLSSKAPFLGAALIGRAIEVRQTTGRSLESRLRGGTLTVSSCTSQEGLHVRGELEAKPFSDLYLGFTYQVESPTCAP